MTPSPASPSVNAPRPRRSLRAVGVASLIALGGLATVGVPSAQAGTYDVDYCQDAGGNPRPLEDWTKHQTEVPGETVTEDCGVPGGAMRTAWTDPAGQHPRGSRTGWSLRTTGGLSIIGWDIGGTANQGANDAAFDLIASTPPPGEGYVGYQCRSWQGCTTAGTPNAAVGGKWSGNTNLLDLSLSCAVNGDANQRCTGPADATITKNRVTYLDTTPPTPSGGVSGPLTDSSPARPLKGLVYVPGAATDAGSGVRRLALQVDGKEVATSPERCAQPFTKAQPCVPGLDATIPVDTSVIPDGSHGATVVAIDAADNAGILWSGTILVGNTGRRGPGTDPALRGAQNGSYGADDAKITAGWPATGRAPSRNKTVRRRCKASKSYRRAHALACSGRPAKRQLSVGFTSKKSNIVRGRLLTSKGVPIVGATVQVLASPRAVGLAPRVVSRPTTGADGRFAAKIPVSAGSAEVAVNWMGRVRDTVPAASVSLRRTVRATTTFSISPKRSVRRGGKITFRGTLRAKTGVRLGNSVSIEVNPGSSWRSVKSVRTRKDGSWRFDYDVLKQLRGTYRFRAVVNPSAGYPFARGESSSRTVVIR